MSEYVPVHPHEKTSWHGRDIKRKLEIQMKSKTTDLTRLCNAQTEHKSAADWGV